MGYLGNYSKILLKLAVYVVLACFVTYPCLAYATDEKPHFLTENTRLTLDVGAIERIDTNKEWNSEVYAGVDLHKVFSTSKRDIALLLCQAYVLRIDNKKKFPGFFDSGDDTAFLLKNCWVDFPILSRNLLNLRIGRTEVAYGLRLIDKTSGTLRQLINGPNLGIIVDWGFVMHGRLPVLDYEIAVGRGSGVNFSSAEDPYVVSGRFATNASMDFVVGLSGFYGDLLTPKGIVNRSRVGLDFQWLDLPVEFVGESSVGWDNEQTMVWNSFYEARIRAGVDTWFVYAQGKTIAKKPNDTWDDSTTAVLGARFIPYRDLTIAMEAQHTVTEFSGAEPGGGLAFHVRYRL